MSYSEMTGAELFAKLHPGSDWDAQTMTIKHRFNKAARTLRQPAPQEGSTVEYMEHELRTPIDHGVRARALMREAESIKARIERYGDTAFASDKERQERMDEQRARLAEVWAEAQFHATMGTVSPDVYVQVYMKEREWERDEV